MKKILCLTDGFSLGGAERQLIGLAYFLKCKGYEVELCSYIKRDFYDSLISSYRLKHICLDTRGGRLNKLIQISHQIKKGKYDWVIAYKDGATIATSILKMLGGRFKLIVSERNTTLSRNRFENFKFWLYSFADFVVPNSYTQKAFIIDNYKKLTQKVVTITNFTDTSFFTPSFRPLEGSREKIIMVAARIAEQKNIIRFLEAIKEVKDKGYNFQVKWYGNASYGEEEYEKKCVTYILENALEGIFTFYPATNNILQEYQSCDIFCLPSIYEGYPNVVCEAMSCGKPVLCSRICDNPYIVEDNVNGMMFNPNDVQDMVKAITTMCELPEGKRLEMGVKSRKIAETKFSEDAFIDKYINLIEQ